MASKVLVAVVAFVVGVGVVYAFGRVVPELERPENEKEDIRIGELEDRLNELAARVEALDLKQEDRQKDTVTLSSRVNILDELMSRMQEKQGEMELSEKNTGENPRGGREPSGGAGDISGAELSRALEGLSEDGREAMRRVIREEIDRIRRDNIYKFESREELVDKARKSINSIEQFLSMTPVQVEQLREIVTRQVEDIVEMQEEALARNDLQYAAKRRVELRMDAEKELVEILTPEQVDKLREADPKGFGKRHPRGF